MISEFSHNFWLNILEVSRSWLRNISIYIWSFIWQKMRAPGTFLTPRSPPNTLCQDAFPPSKSRTPAGLAGLLADACCVVSARSFGGGRAGHHLPLQWWLCHLGDSTLHARSANVVGQMKLGFLRVQKCTKHCNHNAYIYIIHARYMRYIYNSLFR